MISQYALGVDDIHIQYIHEISHHSNMISCNKHLTCLLLIHSLGKITHSIREFCRMLFTDTRDISIVVSLIV